MLVTFLSCQSSIPKDTPLESQSAVNGGYSELYPEDWTLDFTDEEGRFLKDFSNFVTEN